MLLRSLPKDMSTEIENNFLILIRKLLYFYVISNGLFQLSKTAGLKGSNLKQKVVLGCQWLLTIASVILIVVSKKRNLRAVKPLLIITFFRNLIIMIDVEERLYNDTLFNNATFIFLQINAVITLLLCIMLVSNYKSNFICYLIAVTVFSYSFIHFFDDSKGTFKE